MENSLRSNGCAPKSLCELRERRKSRKEFILRSNSTSIPFTTHYFSELTATHWQVVSRKALLREWRNAGYLYLKQYLDRDRVLRLREAYFSQFDASLFRPGTSPAEGLYSGRPPLGLPPYGAFGHPAYNFVRSQLFLDFVDDRRLQQLADCLIGRPSVRLRRTLVRHFFRGTDIATRAHVDFSYLDQGSSDVVTMWIPLGDCPLAAGGLIYLEDSQTLNLKLLQQTLPSDRNDDRRQLTHDLRRLADKTGRRWLWTDFAAGDLIAHSPFMVHASVNNSTDLMRLSTDIHWSSKESDLDPRHQNNWIAGDGY